MTKHEFRPRLSGRFKIDASVGYGPERRGRSRWRPAGAARAVYYKGIALRPGQPQFIEPREIFLGFPWSRGGLLGNRPGLERQR